MVTKLALPAIPTLHENSFLNRIFTLSLPPVFPGKSLLMLKPTKEIGLELR
jgi:hypothetical protein